MSELQGQGEKSAVENQPAIVDSYKRFINNPCQVTIHGFISAAINATADHSHELLSLCLAADPVPIGDSMHLSGGSSGERVPYQVGPHCRIARLFLERFLQGPDLDFEGEIVIYPKEFFPEHRPGRGFGIFDGGDVMIQLNDSASAHLLIKKIETLLSRCHKGIVLYGPFSVFQSLSNVPFFLDYLSSVSDRIILSVLATDAFFRQSAYTSRGIRCNDQMINWRSGLAFYTCIFGVRHCIKNLHAVHDGKMYNLLNFNHKGHDDVSDLIETENSVCSCGRGSIVKRFVPHFKLVSRYPDGRLLHDLSIIEKIDTPLHMLQFLTSGNGRLTCHYLADVAPNKGLIEEHFGLPVDLVPKPFGTLYRKSPAFCGRPDLVKEIGFNAPIRSS